MYGLLVICIIMFLRNRRFKKIYIKNIYIFLNFLFFKDIVIYIVNKLYMFILNC